MNPDNSFSSQKPKCQESRMPCLKSRSVVEPLLCLTAVSEMHPQAQPTYLQTRDLHPLCDDLRQPYDFHESCEMSCHYKEQKSPAHKPRLRNAQRSVECIRNTHHLQHVTVRHHPRKSWKDPASRKS